jgi:hypothetical protein
VIRTQLKGRFNISKAHETVFSHPPADEPHGAERATGEPVTYPDLFRESGAQRQDDEVRRVP